MAHRSYIYVAAILLTVFVATYPFTISRAATVAIAGTHMAALPGASQPAVTHYPSKTKTVYFDYYIVTPVAQDSAEVEVLAGGPSGQVVASAQLLVGIQGPDYATLQLAKGAWADNGYCTVLYVNGIQQTVSGDLPAAWSVGSGVAPRCTPQRAPQLHAWTQGTLRLNHRGAITILVKSQHKVQYNATVTLDGSAIGLKKMIHIGKTNKAGKIRFSGLLGTKKGSLSITVAKTGYRDTRLTIPVAG